MCVVFKTCGKHSTLLPPLVQVLTALRSIVRLVICQQLHSFISLSSLSSDPSLSKNPPAGAEQEGGRCACEARAAEPRFVLGEMRSAICGEGLAAAPTSESHWMVELFPYFCLSRPVLSQSKSPTAWRAEMSSTRRSVSIHKAQSGLIMAPNITPWMPDLICPIVTLFTKFSEIVSLYFFNSRSNL